MAQSQSLEHVSSSSSRRTRKCCGPERQSVRQANMHMTRQTGSSCSVLHPHQSQQVCICDCKLHPLHLVCLGFTRCWHGTVCCRCPTHSFLCG